MTENEYKEELKDKLIQYRKTLLLPENITFGVEIEYENILKDEVSYLLSIEKLGNKNLRHWKNKSEIDIATRNEKGEEVNGEITSPILRDNIETWKSLRTVLNLLKKNNAVATEKCGAHINIGSHILGDDSKYWRNFFLLWLLYEKEIYKFCRGEYIKIRADGNLLFERVSPYFDIDKILDIKNKYYLTTINSKLFDKFHDIYIPKKLPSKKIVLNNKIEFRLPNGTLNEEIWQNYINFFAKFILACRKELDIEKIVYKIENNENDAVELADYVFDNDIDKESFLIQALKTNKVYKKNLLPHISYFSYYAKIETAID